MLTGRRAFAGETVSDILAAVLKGEPDWNGAAGGRPPPSARAAAPLPRPGPQERLQTSATRALSSGVPGPRGQLAAPGSARPPAPPGSRLSPGNSCCVWGRRLPSRPGDDTKSPPSATSVEAGDRPLFLSVGAGVDLFPHAPRLAYVTGDDAGRELYVRALDWLKGQQLCPERRRARRITRSSRPTASGWPM